MSITTARERFDKLDNLRSGLLNRCETYSRWTIPKIFPSTNRVQDVESLAQDFQSLGAQSVNNLCNKFIQALFPAGKPFFRLDFTTEQKQKFERDGVPAAAIARLQAPLAVAEVDASLELDKRSIRSRLYYLLKLLIITGNALMIMDSDNMRVLSLRNYVTIRDKQGAVAEMVIREKVHKDALTPQVLALVTGHPDFKPDKDDYFYEYSWIKRTADGRWSEDRWVCDIKLPAQFSSTYTKKSMKYHAVTWDLAEGDDYGTGLVEDYEGDFTALSMLSQATVHAAILASEFRWLVNPMGQTTVDDFAKSANGSALPGSEKDITLVRSGVENNLQTNIALQKIYIERIGAGFLLQSALIRDSERTTAYEIRKVAEDLEGGLGGAFSRIATDLQIPVAMWTMRLTKRSIDNGGVEPVIITGIAALSRIADRDKLIVLAQGLSALNSVPPLVLQRLKLSSWIAGLCAGEGINPDSYVQTDEEFAAEQDRQRQNALAMQNAMGQIENANTIPQQ